MTLTHIKIHIPFIRTLLLLLALLLGIGFSLGYLQRNNTDSITLQPQDWQWAKASNFDEVTPPMEGWHTYIKGTNVPERIHWIRIPIPKKDWVDPHLKISQIGSLKVVEANNLLYSRTLTNQNNRINVMFLWRTIALSTPLPTHVDLLVRTSALVKVEIGNKSTLTTQMLYEDIDNMILGSLLLFSGFIALGLYAAQRDRLYLYFTLLAVSGGYAAIVCNQLLQLVWDYPLLGYLQDVFLPVGTYAFLGALGQVFPGIHYRTLFYLRRITLLLAVVTLIAAIVSITWYTITLAIFIPLFIVVFLSVYWTTWTVYRLHKDLESIWILAGFTSLATITLLHTYKFDLVRYAPEWLNKKLHWVQQLPTDLLFWGLFTFVICLIRVIMYRYTALNRKLTDFSRSLEEVIETRVYQLHERTEQLEVAHQHLGASMRENAEALAEAMILEERHRITGSIHDKVGHTLSATVIQLEAAKRLLQKDQTLAEEKLVASQELVRRGLEDIRQSVRLLREDASVYDLIGAIGALIREKEQAFGCQVESMLEPLPASLGILQKRIVYQTLQEGLRIGIQMGAINRDVNKDDNFTYRFRLTLRCDYDILLLHMVHLDQTYTTSDIGFGLNAMKDHVEKLGGKISTAATTVGFTLTLELPIVEASNWII